MSSIINKRKLSSSKSHKQNTEQSQTVKKPLRLLNLSQLLDRKLPSPSENIMRDRLWSQRSTRNQSQPKSQNYHSNPPKSKERTPLKINYQHYRSKSTPSIKNYYDSIKSVYDNKADSVNLTYLNNKLSLYKQNSQIIVPLVKGVSLSTSFKSQQLLSQNSFKHSNFAFRQEIYASKKAKENEAMLIMSLEYKKNFEEHELKQSLGPSRDKQNKNFLKKGSSLKKQIVINLLKNKMIKEHQENTAKQYTQCDILEMVKLYKGFLSFPKSPIKNPQVIQKAKVDTNLNLKIKKQNSTKQNIEFLRTYQSLPQRIFQKYPKPIIGWETAPEFDIEELKNQQHTQITMDHSYGLS